MGSFYLANAKEVLIVGVNGEMYSRRPRATPTQRQSSDTGGSLFLLCFSSVGFHLNDKFTEETMACNRKQIGHWVL
jgi:hypothetical protein